MYSTWETQHLNQPKVAHMFPYNSTYVLLPGNDYPTFSARNSLISEIQLLQSTFRPFRKKSASYDMF